jgi:hypothetical protein
MGSTSTNLLAAAAVAAAAVATAMFNLDAYIFSALAAFLAAITGAAWNTLGNLPVFHDYRIFREEFAPCILPRRATCSLAPSILSSNHESN